MQAAQLSREELLTIMRKMLLIRNFEEKVRELFAQGKLPGFVHISVGEEAVPVGICSSLRSDDYITSTHRGHGHCIAKGVDVKLMMAELYGKKTGSSKGKGGSMHIFDNRLGMLGANGIVGAGAPLAVGAALSSKMRKTDQVAVCFFGDGSANQGAIHEAMNLASIWKLPAIFVCENNMYAQYTRHDYDTAVVDIALRARGYDMPGVTVDGMDVMAVREAATKAVEAARTGKGPTLIEAKTYRYYGHNEGDPQVYRSEREVEEWRKFDPIVRLRTKLIHDNVLTEEAWKALEHGVVEEIEGAVKFGEESPLPDANEFLDDVYVSYP